MATRHSLHMMYPKSYSGFINTNAYGGRNDWEDNRVGDSGATGEGMASYGCDCHVEVGASDTRLSDFLRAPRNLGFYLKFIGNYHKLKKQNKTYKT